MILLYLASGQRRYGQRIVHPNPRKRWAFQWIFGKATTVHLHQGRRTEERLQGDYLTVAGPQCFHGWGGEPGDLCTVLVFQFDTADEALSSTIGADGYRCLSVTPEERELGHRLYERCAEALAGPVGPGRLVFAIAAAELALLVLQRLAPGDLLAPSDATAQKVASAMTWYEVNLSQRPSLEETARAVHLSPAHLRRLFHRVLGQSPHEAFARLQFERATTLMHETTLTLETIAEDAGFGSSSAFSRAFKARFGLSPSRYRAGNWSLQENPGR